MRHGRARRLLPALPDGTLPPLVEGELRGHLARCARCRREQRELELAEALLQQLPRRVVPPVWSPASDARLSALARWAVEPGFQLADRWQLPAVSAATAFAVACLALAVGIHGPLVDSRRPGVAPLFDSVPEVSAIPVGWRSGR